MGWHQDASGLCAFQEVWGHNTSAEHSPTHVTTSSTWVHHHSVSQHHSTCITFLAAAPLHSSQQANPAMSEATQPPDPTAKPESQTAPKGLGAGEPTQPTESPTESPTEPRTTVESFEIQEAAANQATEEAYDAADWMQPAAARWLSPPSSCLGRPLPGNTGVAKG